MVSKEVRPSLKRNWLTYESYKLTPTNNVVNGWKVYLCEVTTHHEAYTNFKVIVTFYVDGEKYATHVVNGWTGVVYKTIVCNFDGGKFGPYDISSDKDIDTYIDKWFGDIY